MAKRKAHKSIHSGNQKTRTNLPHQEVKNKRRESSRGSSGLTNTWVKKLGSGWSPNWLSGVVFVCVCSLIFYPPYFRGLFFDKELLPTHVITAIIYALVWVDKFRRRDLRFIQNPLDWAVLAYAGAYLLSIAGAVHTGDAIKGFLKALNYFMVYWMVTQVVRDYKTYETVLRVLFASALGVAAIGIAAATGFSHYPGAFENGRIMSTLQYPNTLATYMAVMSLIGISLWLREERYFLKVAYSLGTTVMVLIAIVAASKGGWIILVLGGLLLLAGMPGVYRLKSMYYLMAAAGSATIGTMKFLPGINAGNNSLAFQGLALTAILVVIAQLVWEGLVIYYRRKGARATLGIAVIFVAIAVAGLLQSSLHTRISAEVLPSSLVTRIKHISDTHSSSYVTRMELNFTALRIIKDHPLLGVGAGGWNALYHQYQSFLDWTTETHNHFLQVWVEGGIFGFVAYLAMWVLLLYNICGLYRKNPAREDWAMNWGVASAALAFGAHSAIDFDLSISAMTIVLWSLLAVAVSGGRIFIPQTPVRDKEPGWLKAVALVLSLLLLVPGTCFASAYRLQQQAISWAMRNQVDQAEECMRRAVVVNPWDGAQHAYFAKILALKYTILQKNKHPQANLYLSLAQQAAHKAERLEPFNLKMIKDLQEVYSALGDGQSHIRVLEMGLRANPLDSYTYYYLAYAYLRSAQYYGEQGDEKKAADYLSKLFQTSDLLNQRIAAVKARYPDYAGEMERPPALEMVVGQGLFLEGRYEKALQYLNMSAAESELSPESNTWKAAALYKMGQKDEASRLINRVAAQEAQYRQVYDSLLQTRPVCLEK